MIINCHASRLSLCLRFLHLASTNGSNRRGAQQERLPASSANNTPDTRSCCGKTRVTANSSLIFHLSLVPFPTATSCGVTQMRLNDDMPESRGTYRIVDHSDSYAHGHKGGESTG